MQRLPSSHFNRFWRACASQRSAVRPADPIILPNRTCERHPAWYVFIQAGSAHANARAKKLKIGDLNGPIRGQSWSARREISSWVRGRSLLLQQKVPNWPPQILFRTRNVNNKCSATYCGLLRSGSWQGTFRQELYLSNLREAGGCPLRRANPLCVQSTRSWLLVPRPPSHWRALTCLTPLAARCYSASRLEAFPRQN
jgi:hypothetical protein